VSGLEGSASLFDWFRPWLGPYDAVCLTFARVVSVAQMFAAFDADLGNAVPQTYRQAVRDDLPTRVRVGEAPPWTYAVETFTSLGAQSRTLRDLSRSGGEAVSLSIGVKMQIAWAVEGDVISRCDLNRAPGHRALVSSVPADRLSTAVQRLDGRRDRAASLLEVLASTFGIVVDVDMLERSLPSAWVSIEREDS
jgi:hypothetical protein